MWFKQMRKYIIGGNWKMQITRVGNAEKIAQNIANTIENITSVDVDRLENIKKV